MPHRANAAPLDPQRHLRLRIASPCFEDWDGMEGDEHVRRCTRCTRDVYNLSTLTFAEAQAVLVQRGASVCVTFYTRADGTLLTEDCPSSSQARRAHAAAGGALAAAAAACAIGALSARASPPLVPTIDVITRDGIATVRAPSPLVRYMGGVDALPRLDEDDVDDPDAWLRNPTSR